MCKACTLHTAFQLSQSHYKETKAVSPSPETTKEKEAKKRKRMQQQTKHYSREEAIDHIHHTRCLASQTRKRVQSRQSEQLKRSHQIIIERLAHHFPAKDSKSIQETLRKHACTEQCCGTSLVYGDLRIIASSLDSADAVGKMPSTLGEGRGITVMVSGLYHASSPPHHVVEHMGNYKQQCHDTAKIALERHGVAANHHPAIAVQVPLANSSCGTAATFAEGLPRSMSADRNFQAWARERYKLADLHQRITPRGSTTEYTKWVEKHFFCLQLQYQFETAMQEDVQDLLADLRRAGIGYEILTVENDKQVPGHHEMHANRYPFFTRREQEVVERLATSADSSSSSSRSVSTTSAQTNIRSTRSMSSSCSTTSTSTITSSSSAGGGATFPAFIDGDHPTAYLCSLVTIIQDSNGRVLVVYIPEISSRENTKKFFSCFGDGYLDESLQGIALNESKVSRPTVHSNSNVWVETRDQAMTMFGVRADACNTRSDGKLTHESQQLWLYKIHRKKEYDNAFGDLKKFKAAFDPAVTEWQSMLPRFFQLVSYCNKDMMGAARSGYARNFVPASLDSQHVISNAGYSDSYPSPSHHDPDLGFCFAFAGKCYLDYMCRRCDETTGEVEWQTASGTK